MTKVLILEDSPERIKAFRAAVDSMNKVQALFWDSAREMIAELPVHLKQVGLISLDYDLVPYSKSAHEPGTGLDVCAYLATVAPVCPIIVHTSNEEAVWPMLFKLGEAKWETEWLRHETVGEFWIGRLWIPRVLSYIEALESGRSGQPDCPGPSAGPTNPAS